MERRIWHTRWVNRNRGAFGSFFDRRLKLEFHGSKITSDAGLLAYRELDDALGLTEMAEGVFQDSRTGKNGWHGMTGQFRQSVFGRLGDYDDVNGADRLGRDPAMRWIVGGKAIERQAASTSQMGRFETELLATDENVEALVDMNGVWIDKVHDRHPPKMIILDMDSSVSPTHGEQEGTAYNGHFGCTCYHPLFLFNQFGDLERCSLRPGNVHSADGWRNVLEPVVMRYKERKVRLYFRGDAAFASPEIYEYLEAEGLLYVIRLKANAILQRNIAHLLTRPVGRPPDHVRRFHASFSYQAGSWNKKRRVVAKVEWHPGELVPRVGFIVTNLSRPTKRVVAFYNHRGTAEQPHQGRQERHQLDPSVMSQVPQQCRSAPASRPGLQSGQLHEDTGFAEGGGALVDDDVARQAGEDRGQGCPTWPPTLRSNWLRWRCRGTCSGKS